MRSSRKRICDVGYPAYVGFWILLARRICVVYMIHEPIPLDLYLASVSVIVVQHKHCFGSCSPCLEKPPASSPQPPAVKQIIAVAYPAGAIEYVSDAS
jgi:hypothetical protein